MVCDDTQEPLTLDPQKEFTEKNHTVVQQIFDGLVRFDPKGMIEPSLATSWDRINPTTVQFHLRSGVLFHNGEPFDARAVKFSIERYLDPATAFPARGFIDSIDHVDIIDLHTINLVTKYPDSLLLNRLAGFIVIVPPAYVVRNHGQDWNEHPVGTGAFQFKSWKHNQEIELEANPHYWEQGWPKITHLYFRFLDTKDQLRELIEGGLGMATDIPGTETLNIERSRTATVIKCPTLYTVAASFNVTTGPLKNIYLRQALNYAIDKEELIRYDLLGNGYPVKSLVLTDESTPLDESKLDLYPYDPEKAKELLKMANYDARVPLRMLEVKAERAAKIIIAQWKRVGIAAQMVSSTDAKINEDVRKADWDIVLGACPDPMHHPFFIHSIFLYSKSPFSLTRDPELDKLIEALPQEFDPAREDQKIQQLASYVNKNALSLFTYQRIKTYGVHKNVHFQAYSSGMPYFRRALVDGQESVK